MSSAEGPGEVTVSGTRLTGHRGEEEYVRLFERWVGPFLSPGVVVYVGGAIGIDTLALRWLLGKADVRVEVVVPGRAQDQPAAAQEAIREAGRVADRVVLVELGAEPLDVEARHRRNHYMVDRSELVIGFPRADEPQGGTWHTLGYAADRRVPHLVVQV
jgi:hypothetical protein